MMPTSTQRFTLLLLIICQLPLVVLAQSGTITGRLADSRGVGLSGASVIVKNTNKGTVADRDGRFLISNVAAGSYTVVATAVGFRSQAKSVTVGNSPATVDFSLDDDALALDEVIVTGSFDPRTKLESSVAITTLNATAIQQRAPRSTGDLLQSVPGLWVDNSTGEVGAKVVARGLAPVGNDQVGMQYVSLQEEGLPVMGAQMGFTLIDMFQRTDITTARLEAIRGGSAAITAANSPGGIFNFISRTGGPTFSGSARLTGGLNGNGNGLGRVDAELGGPLTRGFMYHIGGFYRVDQGARNTPFNANQGGQIKANISKTFKNGSMLKVYGKYLNDQNTFFKEIALNNDFKKGYDPGNGDPVDINYSTTFVDIKSQVPLTTEVRKENLGANLPYRTFDARKGIQNKTWAVGLDYTGNLGNGWGLNVRGKVSYFDQAYIQYQNNTVLPLTPSLTATADLAAQAGYLQYGTSALTNPANYAAAGSAAASAIVNAFLPAVLSPTYYDAKTGDVLARATGSLTNGVATSTLDLNTPNKLGKYYLATTGLNFYNKSYDYVGSAAITKDAGRHALTFGTYYSHTEINTSWFADGASTSLGGHPRALRIEFPIPTIPDLIANSPSLNATWGGLFDPKGGTYKATDANGLSLHSGLGYTQTKNVSALNAVYANDVWKATDRLTVDLGLRYETVRQTGVKQGWQTALALGGLGGLDQNLFTTYDINSRVYNGDSFVYGVTYQPTSATASALARDATGKIIVADSDPTGDGDGFRYDYLSGSVGANYKLTDQTATYLRVSRGNKAPELDYYANNFVNVPVDKKAPVETVTQAELGVKTGNRRVSLTATGFYSYLNNALLQLFIQNGAASFFTDPTFNATRTIGLELETVLNPTNRLNIRAHATIQDAKYAKLSYQNTASTTDKTKFFIEDFAGNRVLGVAPVIIDLTPTYRIGRFSPYLNYRWFSERQGNRRNSIQLPAYGVLGAGIVGELTSRLLLAVQGSNLLNGAGVLIFGGYGLQGTSVEDVAKGGVKRPDGTILPGTDLNKLNALGSPVFGRPILPRQVTVSLTWRF